MKQQPSDADVLWELQEAYRDKVAAKEAVAAANDQWQAAMQRHRRAMVECRQRGLHVDMR